MSRIFYSGQFIRVESQQNGVKKILLNRPQVKNAFHAQMIEELSQTFISLAKISDENDMRLLILEGEGDTFSAGADLNYMKEQAQKPQSENSRDAHKLGRMFYQLASFPSPVLCAVKGAAMGGALGLTVCADYVLCNDKAVFATSEVLLGLVPGTISPHIIRKLGVAHASFFMLSGNKMGAQEALNVGLVNEVSSDENFALSLERVVGQFLMAGPLAARKTKELIRHCSPLPSQELFEFCADQISLARSTQEAQNGLSAFFEKKTPYWRDFIKKD